jgi:MFS family permease
MYETGRNPKVFFGWWIVGASFIIAMYLGGVVFYGFTAIFEPIAAEFGWSHSQISLAVSLRGMETGLFAPLAGNWADRWGPRRLVFGGILGTALGLIMLSYTNSLAMFYGSYVIIAAGMSATTITVLTTAIANWFRRRMSLAVGIAVSGFGAGGLLVPLMVKLINDHGWRISLILMAAGIIFLILPLSVLFRHKPEQYGYTTDGFIKASVEPGPPEILPHVQIPQITRKKALKSRVFWHLTLAFTFYYMTISAVFAHVMPYLSSVGIARGFSGMVATILPLISIGGRLGFGWLGDKTSKQYIASVTFLMSAVGLLCFSYTTSNNTGLLIPFMLLFGLGYGGSTVLRSSMAREIYGRRSFGSVFGFLVGINMIGGIAGPVLAGAVYDKWSSYQPIWITYSVLAVMSMLAILTMRFTSLSSPNNAH